MKFHGINVVAVPGMGDAGGLILPYKSPQPVDAGSFYAPYVPLVAGSSDFYWHAKGVYENLCPAEISNVCGHTYMYYEWAVMVLIDGHFMMDQYKEVHQRIAEWSQANGVKGPIWDEEHPDVALFHSMDDALLFRITFGEKQSI